MTASEDRPAGSAHADDSVDAKATAVRLDRSGVESHAVHVDAHRTDDTALREIIGGEMGWLLGDDPRWTGAGN